MMKERCPEKFRTNCHWSRSVKATVRKRLVTLPILVYCARSGALHTRFVFNFWWFFVVLDFYLSTVPVFIRPSSDGTYYGMVMSVRPSVRPGLRPSVRPSVRPSQFSALFSYMLWDIELKFCISLYYDARKSKFECHQFPSIFDGVMPLFNFKLLQICSFPHFSPSCFDILSWNFAYDFVLLYYRTSLSVANFRQFLLELCPFWNLEYWKYTVFRTFLLHTLTY